jgi:hypothetical protein
MNADQPILFNPRLSVFIGGQPCFGFFQQPLKAGGSQDWLPHKAAEEQPK